MRKVLVCLLTLALVLGCMSVQAEGVLTPGTYTSTMTAMHGPMTVEVTVTDSAITSVEVVDQVETPGVTDPVFEKIPAAIVDNQTTAVVWFSTIAAGIFSNTGSVTPGVST